jgi:hypothetical protein
MHPVNVTLAPKIRPTQLEALVGWVDLQRPIHLRSCLEGLQQTVARRPAEPNCFHSLLAIFYPAAS